MGNSIAPRGILTFNGWIRNTDDYNRAESDPGPPPINNGQRLLLTDDEIDQWHTKRLTWDNDLFGFWNDPAKKTKQVNRGVEQFIRDFPKFSKKLLKRMSASGNATLADAAVYGFI